MFKNLKKLLQFFIVATVSIFLFPTILRLVGMETYDFENISNLLIFLDITASIFSGVIAIIIIYKSKNADRLLQKAAARDAVWNEENLKVQTRAVFYKVLTAWNNEDASLVEEYVTDDYLQFFKKRLATKTEANVTDILNSIDISETRIICCQDFLNNEKDKFVGYLTWNFSNDNNEEDDDSEGSVSIEWGSRQNDIPEQFSEMYHFIRHRNDWLLNKSDDNVGFWNLLTERSIYEQ